MCYIIFSDFPKPPTPPPNHMNIQNFPQLLAFLESATRPDELASAPLTLLRRASDMAGCYVYNWHPYAVPQKVFDHRHSIIKALHEVLANWSMKRKDSYPENPVWTIQVATSLGTVTRTYLMFLTDLRVTQDPANAGLVEEAIKKTGIDVSPEPRDTYYPRLALAARKVMTDAGDGTMIPNGATKALS